MTYQDPRLSLSGGTCRHRDRRRPRRRRGSAALFRGCRRRGPAQGQPRSGQPGGSRERRAHNRRDPAPVPGPSHPGRGEWRQRRGLRARVADRSSRRHREFPPGAAGLLHLGRLPPSPAGGGRGGARSDRRQPLHRRPRRGRALERPGDAGLDPARGWTAGFWPPAIRSAPAAPSNQYLDVFRDVFLEVRSIRRCGAAALDLAYTAAGVYDGFLRIPALALGFRCRCVVDRGGRWPDHRSRRWRRLLRRAAT